MEVRECTSQKSVQTNKKKSVNSSNKNKNFLEISETFLLFVYFCFLSVSIFDFEYILNTSNLYSKYHSGYTAIGIMFQAFVIYPAVMARRWLDVEHPTWFWENCTSIHISMSMFQVVRPENNFGYYFAGQFPQACFCLCRFIIVVECIFPVLLIICAFMPSNFKKFKKLQLFITFSLMMMHVGFATFFRLSNFVFSGT